MARKRIAAVVAALLIFSILPGMALAAEVSLDLSRNAAAVGDSVAASGNAGPDEPVCIKAVDSFGSIVVFDIAVSASDGRYSYSFKVPRVSPGTLTVTAGCGKNVETKALQVSGEGSGALNSIAITKPAAKIIYTVGETLDISGLVVTGSYSDGSSKIEDIAVANISGFDSSKPVARQTLTVSLGDKTANYAVAISEPVTAVSDKNIIITNTPLTITVPENSENTGIQVPQNSPLPPIKAKSDQVEMTIAHGTVISGSDTLQLPEVKPSSSVKVAEAQKVDLVIQVGSGTNTITFDKPVRLLLKGQGNKSAGFIDNDGKFRRIGRPASLTGLAGDGDADAVAMVFEREGLQEGAVTSGSDLIIWTKHFTAFLAYTPVSFKPPVIAIPEIIEEILMLDEIIRSQTISSRGGIIKTAGAMLIFPSNAVSEDIKVSIKKLGKDSIPAIPSGLQLLGQAYEITADDKEIAFAKPVTVTLYFDPNKVDNGKHDAGIYCWSNNQWLLLEQVQANMETGKVSGTVNHFSKFALLLSEKSETASDQRPPSQEAFQPVKVECIDITGHWAEKFIRQLLATGAVSGYPDGTFKPDNTVTRAEFITMAVKAFELKPRSGKVFTDISRHWAKDSISTAAAHGIVSGYDETVFGPDDPVTREQMAVVISKAARLSGGEGKTYADSSQIADWAREAVAAASGKNIIRGYPDNTFGPRADATRAEAVTVIVKALN